MELPTLFVASSAFQVTRYTEPSPEMSFIVVTRAAMLSPYRIPRRRARTIQSDAADAGVAVLLAPPNQKNTRRASIRP
jgi:hypothetical protein